MIVHRQVFCVDPRTLTYDVLGNVLDVFDTAAWAEIRLDPSPAW